MTGVDADLERAGTVVLFELFLVEHDADHGHLQHVHGGYAYAFRLELDDGVGEQRGDDLDELFDDLAFGRSYLHRVAAPGGGHPANPIGPNAREHDRFYLDGLGGAATIAFEDGAADFDPFFPEVVDAADPGDRDEPETAPALTFEEDVGFFLAGGADCTGTAAAFVAAPAVLRAPLSALVRCAEEVATFALLAGEEETAVLDSGLLLRSWSSTLSSSCADVRLRFAELACPPAPLPVPELDDDAASTENMPATL